MPDQTANERIEEGKKVKVEYLIQVRNRKTGVVEADFPTEVPMKYAPPHIAAACREAILKNCEGEDIIPEKFRNSDY